MYPAPGQNNKCSQSVEYIFWALREALVYNLVPPTLWGL